MTDEHIPPKSTGNDVPVRALTDPFNLDEVLEEVAEWDEGHVVRTLDRRCNGRASDWGYVKEYRRWHALFLDAHVAGRATRIDPFRGDKPFSIELPYDVMPARFVRQVIGMLLAVQESSALLAGFPALGDLVGECPTTLGQPREDGLLTEGFHLYMSVYSGRWAYGASPLARVTIDMAPTALHLPPGARAAAIDMYVLALAPFAFVGTSEPLDHVGLSITKWTDWGRSQRPARRERWLELPTIDVMEPGIRAMLSPIDYVIR